MSDQEQRLEELEGIVADLIAVVEELADRQQRPAVQEWVQRFKARGRS